MSHDSMGAAGILSLIAFGIIMAYAILGSIPGCIQ